jgi:hypothetical protein
MKYRSSKGKSAVIVSSSFNLSTACVEISSHLLQFSLLAPEQSCGERRQRLKTLGNPAPRDCDPPVSPSGALDRFSRERGSDEGHQTYYSDNNHAHPTAHTINAIPHQLLHAIAFTASQLHHSYYTTPVPKSLPADTRLQQHKVPQTTWATITPIPTIFLAFQ